MTAGHQPQADQAGGVAAAVAAADAVLPRERARLHDQQRMPQAYHAKPARAGGKLLVPCTQRMLASDIIYTDSYSTPAAAHPAERRHRRPGADVGVPRRVRRVGADPGRHGRGAAALEAQQRRPRPARAEPGHGGGAAGRRQAGDAAGGDGERGQGARDVVPGHAPPTAATSPSSTSRSSSRSEPGPTRSSKTATIARSTKGQQQTVTIGGFESTTLQFDKAVPLKVAGDAGAR